MKIQKYMMPIKCNHCGEVAVDDTENIMVCHACGIVAQETQLSGCEYSSFAYKTFHPKTKFEARILYKKKNNSTCLLFGLEVLDQLFHINAVSSSATRAEVTELFKGICSSRQFRFKEDAATAAACCLFFVQRKNKQAIPIKKLCQQTPCSRGKFSFYLNVLKSYSSANTIEKNSSSDIFPSAPLKMNEKSHSYLSDMISSMIIDVCEKAEEQEKLKLMEKVAALVKLSDDCWLLPGRSPRSVVVASAFLCWKSMNPLRKKASFNKFCSTFEIKEPIAKRRIQELQAFLLKLGQKIPSYSENQVNEQNFIFYLDMILEHSEMLRNDLLPDVHSSEAVSFKEYSTFRFPAKTQPRKEPESSVTYPPDMNASDIEISDSEIESYITSDKKKIVDLCEKKK